MYPVEMDLAGCATFKVEDNAVKPYPARVAAFEFVVVEPNAITPHVPDVVGFAVMKMYCAVPPDAGIDTIVLAPPKVLTVRATPPVL